METSSGKRAATYLTGLLALSQNFSGGIHEAVLPEDEGNGFSRRRVDPGEIPTLCGCRIPSGSRQFWLEVCQEEMPIYLVRWPDLWASLVRAKNEEHLLDILDQAADPEGCEWLEYEGPIAIDFRLPAKWNVKDERPGRPLERGQVVIEDLGPMAGEHTVESLELSLAEGDEGHEMGEAILEKAFPFLQAAAETFRASKEAEEIDFILPEADLRKALHAELAWMLKASWRHARVKRGKDPVSKLAQELDLPMDLARKYAEIASERRRGQRRTNDTWKGLATSVGPEEKMSTGRPLFSVSNHHVESCGEPAAVDGDAQRRYVACFANEYGEQAIYIFDFKTGEATLTMGDTGWQVVHPVVNGKVGGLLVTEAEIAWLRACWLATGRLVQRSRSDEDAECARA